MRKDVPDGLVRVPERELKLELGPALQANVHQGDQAVRGTTPSDHLRDHACVEHLVVLGPKLDGVTFERSSNLLALNRALIKAGWCKSF